VTVLYATAIEGMQLLVQSRVSDTTDIVSAAAGAAVGVWIGARLRAASPDAGAAAALEPRRRYVGLALLAIAWSAVLVFGFTYPFNFHYDASTLHARTHALIEVPFRTYWLATEARAVSDLLLQLALFAPHGALFALAAARRRAAWAWGAAACVTAGAVAAGIEVLQVFLPARTPDSTDIVVAAIGGVAGYAAFRALLRAAHRGEAPARDEARGPEPVAVAEERGSPGPASGGRRAAIGLAVVAYGILLVAGYVAAKSPSVPYNVRELFGRGGHLALIGFPLVVLAAFAPPWIVARWCSGGGWRRSALLPLFVAAHGGVAWFGIRAGAPLEAIYDVVGSPVLRWYGDLEITLRFLALFAAFSTLYVGGAHLAASLAGPRPERDPERRALARWAAMAAPILGLSYVVVVRAACTDNLTELMAGGGSILAAFWLAIWILTLATSASLAAAVSRGRAHPILAVVGVGSGVALGWLALSLGTAHHIEKYGATFSAMQFLFSADRKHYASGQALLIRYAIAHAGVVLAAALAQMPFAGRGLDRRA
jgi:VanZ family protein